MIRSSLKNGLRFAVIFFATHIYAISDIASVREGFVFTSAPFKSCHASTILKVDGNDLLCAFFAGDQEAAKGVGIWICQSTRGSSGLPRLVAFDKNKEPCWNPVLFSLGDQILLFYKVGPSPATWSGVLKRSLNGRKTWRRKSPSCGHLWTDKK